VQCPQQYAPDTAAQKKSTKKAVKLEWFCRFSFFCLFLKDILYK